MKGNFLFCYKVLPRSTALQYKNSTIMVAKWNWLTIFMQVWEWLEWIYDARLRLAFRKMRESECAKVVTQVSILYQIVLPTFHIFPCFLFLSTHQFVFCFFAFYPQIIVFLFFPIFYFFSTHRSSTFISPVHLPRQKQKPKLWFVCMFWNKPETNEPINLCNVILRAWFVCHRHYLERTKTFVLGFVFVFVLAHEQAVGRN